MQDIATPFQQPFIKLAQSNMRLWTEFSTSPEVLSQFTAAATQALKQASELGLQWARSGAFVTLTQGLARNYTQFLFDCGESAQALMSQHSMEMAGGFQNAFVDAVTDAVTDAVEVPSRRRR